MNNFSIPKSWVNRPIKILMIGAGGTGSALFTELYQMSFLLNEISEGSVYLDITLVDHDTVSFANVGRQNFWVHDLNLNKAKVLVERFNTFGGIKWSYSDEKYSPTVSNIRDIDILITAVDTAKTRSEIGIFFENMQFKNEKLWLDLGNNAHSAQMILGHLGLATERLPNVFDLYPELSSIIDDKTNSCSHVQALAKQGYGINKKVAIEASILLWQLIRNGSIQRHGSFIDINDGTTIPLPIDPIHWSMLGYKPKQDAIK